MGKKVYTHKNTFLNYLRQASNLDGGMQGGRGAKRQGHLAAQGEDRGIVIRDLRKEYRLSRGRARVALKVPAWLLRLSGQRNIVMCCSQGAQCHLRRGLDHGSAGPQRGWQEHHDRHDHRHVGAFQGLDRHQWDGHCGGVEGGGAYLIMIIIMIIIIIIITILSIIR